MSGSKFWSGRLAWLLGLSLLLGACGEASVTPAQAPATTTVAPGATTAAVTPALAAPTTASVTIAAATTVVATTAPATTLSPATPTPAATPAGSGAAPSFATVVALTAAALTANPEPTPSPTATIAGQTAIPPTITTGPTPQPQPVTTGWVKDGVCYEVFVRSFFDSNGDGKGDLNGLIARLDYLNDGQPNSTKSLRVNCLWLMPVAQSPSYHGYDTTDYYKINPDYGTNDDFKRLMAEAHRRGIYIITDLVLNHTSSQHEWFKQAAADPKSPYRDYYIFSPTNPGYLGQDNQTVWHKNPLGEGYYYAVFDAALPDLNLRNPAVTRQLQDITRFWLQEMGVDGFRIDAARHFVENGRFQIDTPESKAWLRDFKKFYSSIKPDAFTIGEIFSQFNQALAGYYPDQLDYYFEFNVAKGLLDSATADNAGFVNNAANAYRTWPFQRYGTFLTNHDQNRVFSVLGGNRDKMKMAAIAYLTLPGLPFIYYGEEIGMLGTKPDERIRTPMQWSGGAGAGFTTGQPWQPLGDNAATVHVQAQDTDPDSLLNLYRRLTGMRRSTPALAQGSFTPLQSGSDTVAAYLRRSGNQQVLVLINMGEKPVSSPVLSAESSDLPPSRYTAASTLFAHNNPGAALAPLTVATGGAVSNYAPVASLPARSALVVVLNQQ